MPRPQPRENHGGEPDTTLKPQDCSGTSFTHARLGVHANPADLVDQVAIGRRSHSAQQRRSWNVLDTGVFHRRPCGTRRMDARDVPLPDRWGPRWRSGLARAHLR